MVVDAMLRETLKFMLLAATTGLLTSAESFAIIRRDHKPKMA
jgi:hypothetical protein